MADNAPGDRLQSLGMFASALAGRPVAVAELPAGEPSWTDGQTIYVDGSAPVRSRLSAIAVQACLIAAGSLDADVLRPLVRHPRLARRYLAVEGHRSLVSNAELLELRRQLQEAVDSERYEEAARFLDLLRKKEATDESG